MRVRFLHRNGAYFEGADPVLDPSEATRLIKAGICEPYEKPAASSKKPAPADAPTPLAEEPAAVDAEAEPAEEPAASSRHIRRRG